MVNIEEYDLAGLLQFFAIKGGLNMGFDDSVIIVYKDKNNNIAIKRFIDYDNYINFSQYIIEALNLLPTIKGKGKIPVVRIKEFNTQYRFKTPKESISFFISSNKNKPFINTNGVEPINSSGISINKEDWDKIK